MKNLKRVGQKRSKLERSLNRFVFAAFVVNMVLLVSSVLLELDVFYDARARQEAADGRLYQWYLGADFTAISPQTVCMHAHLFINVLPCFCVCVCVCSKRQRMC